MTPLERLALELPTTRGAHPAWVSSLWMEREVPAWLGDPRHDRRAGTPALVPRRRPE